MLGKVYVAPPYDTSIIRLINLCVWLPVLVDCTNVSTRFEIGEKDFFCMYTNGTIWHTCIYELNSVKWKDFFLANCFVSILFAFLVC